jgi:acetyl-CoA carboxylase alpha subunit
MIDETKQPGEEETMEEIHRRIKESEAANLTADAIVLDAWDRVKLARHTNRPYTLDYIEALFTDFTEIHGDRRYGDDSAMIAGLARFHGAH